MSLGELQRLVTLSPDLAPLGPDSSLLRTLGDLWNLPQGLRVLQTPAAQRRDFLTPVERETQTRVPSHAGFVSRGKTSCSCSTKQDFNSKYAGNIHITSCFLGWREKVKWKCILLLLLLLSRSREGAPGPWLGS